MSRYIVSTIALLAAGLVLAGCGIGDSQTQVRSAIDAKNAELAQCYSAALGRTPGVSGSMQAWVHVEDAGGTVDTVEYTGGDLDDPELQSCMTTALQGVQLDKPPPANLKIEYTFEFTPAS